MLGHLDLQPALPRITLTAGVSVFLFADSARNIFIYYERKPTAEG